VDLLRERPGRRAVRVRATTPLRLSVVTVGARVTTQIVEIPGGPFRQPEFVLAGPAASAVQPGQ
jgi:hypothetical protein